MPPSVRKRLLIDILDSARTGRTFGSIAKDFEVTRETVRRYKDTLKALGYDVRNPNWTDPPELIVEFITIGKFDRLKAATPKHSALTTNRPIIPPSTRDEGIQGAPPIKTNGLLTLEDRRQLLSAIAGAANLPPQARVAAVKLLDDIELTHRPAETYAPSPPLTSEERLARLRRILSCFSQEEIQTATAS